MEWSKLKNVILLILVGVNLFFVVLIAYRQSKTVYLEQEAKEDLIQALNINGISMGTAQFPQENKWPNLQINWDVEQARGIAEAVLGNVTEESRGSAAVYTGADGSAVFYSDGVFSVAVNVKQEHLSRQAAEEYAKLLIQQMGLETGPLEEQTTEDETISFVAIQQAEGYGVFNCPITITYAEDGIFSMQGTCLLGEIKYRAAQQSTISVFTALTKLIQYEADHGSGIKEIQFIQVGYLLPTISASTVQLEPVWHVTTDHGQYDVSGTTGIVKKTGSKI